MKKLYFPVLAFCLSFAGRINAQSTGTTSSPAPVFASQGQGAPYFYAYVNPSDDKDIHRVTLRWQLQSEYNTDHFVLERAYALNPTQFYPLHELVAQGGQEGPAQLYEEQDNEPLTGQVSYYRLKVVLKDGDAFYSPVVAVDMSGKSSLTLKPSVLTTGGTLHLNSDARQPVFINFFDENGRRMATYLVNSSYFDINTAGWSRGIYIYRISDNEHALIEVGKIMLM